MVLMARIWWAILIRGIAAVIFGILAIFWPGTTFIVLTLLFGAYALVDGIFALVGAFRSSDTSTPRGWLLFEGVTGIIAGIAAFLFTGIAALALLFVIAAWAIITGILEIAQAVELRRMITHEWLLILSGVASVIFGLLLLLFPGMGMLVVALIIGIYAIFFGALQIGLSLRLRALHQRESTLGSHGNATARTA